MLGQTDPVGAKMQIFQLIFARSTSAVTPIEKVTLTRIGNLLHAFK